MKLTNKSYLKSLDVEQNAYQWVNNNFESKLLVHGDITHFFKDVDKERLEKALYSLLTVGVFDINAEQLRDVLIHNPTLNINGKDKNFHELIEGFMLNFAEIQGASKALKLEAHNLILTSSKD
jgi:hypothetical protein